MSTALELIRRVEAGGGHLRVEGDELVVHAVKSATPLDELRQHKAEILAALLKRDADRWRQAVTRWLITACAVRPRDFTNVNHLLIAFNEWASGPVSGWAANPGQSCSREVFEFLLLETDHVIGDVCGVRLAAGLMLREDWLAQQAFERMDAMPAMPAAYASRRGGARR